MAKDLKLIQPAIVLRLNRGEAAEDIARDLDVQVGVVEFFRRKRDAVEILFWLNFGDTSKEIVRAGYMQQQVAAIVGANRRRTGKSSPQAQL